MHMPYIAMLKPEQICSHCWRDTPAHPLVRNFITYCSHTRVLAVSGAAGLWEVKPDIGHREAAAKFDLLAQRLPTICPASMRPGIDEAVDQIKTHAAALRAHETSRSPISARIWS